MRKVALNLIPMLLLACNQEPTAPALPELSADLTSATSDWVYWELGPFSDVDFGPVSCLRDAHMYGFGGVSGRSRWITRPDGRVVEKWWTLTLWDTYHVVVAGETWWPVDHRARSGVTIYDENGNIVADHGNGAVFTLQNEITGALLYYPAHWQFQTDANGVVRVDNVLQGCWVRN